MCARRLAVMAKIIMTGGNKEMAHFHRHNMRDDRHFEKSKLTALGKTIGRVVESMGPYLGI
jgi:hypothetical protein